MATSAETAVPARGLVSGRPYIPVFVMLGILTLIEVWIAGFDITQISRIFTLMIFAIGKASLVVLYYMHLRYEPRLLSLVPIIPVFMALALVVTLIAELI